MAGSLGDLFVKVGADITGFNEAMGDINDKLKGVAKDVAASNAGFKAAFQNLQQMGIGLTAAVTLPLAGLGYEAIAMSEKLNLARLAFETLLGSGQKAGAFLNELKDFAAKTPFQFPELVEASKRMLALGFNAKDVVPTLRTIGDAAAALGGGAQLIDRITLALGQMGAKGKVSAQEMNQLAEAGIPAWEMLANRIGKSIPEAMKLAESGAIAASIAIPAILEGMNAKFAGGMDKASKTLTGVWSNFQDQSSYILADIGNQLAPILKDLVANVAIPFLSWVKDMTTWFTNLDPTIQKVILGFGLMAAAIGPVMIAVGTLGQAWIGVQAAFAAMGPLFSAAGTAISAVFVPALLAAVTTIALFQLAGIISDLNELTSEVFGVADAWASFKSIFAGSPETMREMNKETKASVGYWDDLGSALRSLDWKNLLTGPLGAARDAIQGLTNALRVIKGEWPSMSKASTDALGKLQTANKNMAKSAYDAAMKIVEHKDSQDKARAAAESFTVSLAKQTEAHKKHKEAVGIELSEMDKFNLAEESSRVATAALNTEFERWNQRTLMVGEGMQILDGITKAHTNSMAVLKGAYADAAVELGSISMTPAIGELQKLEGSWRTLGITSQAELNKQKDAAIAAYKTIAASNLSTAEDIQRAYEAMTAAVNRANAGMATSTEESVAKQKTVWQDFSTQVSTIFTDFSRDIAKSLFDGDTSFGEKFKNMAKSLGEAVVRMFVEPATAAIGKFIGGVLADLLGGKGFGGIMDKIKDIGGTIGDIFGGGSQAAGGAGGAAGGAGSAAGAAQAATSTLAGWIGAIGSAVSAITGIIGNFQNAQQEKTLNAIEESTRYMKSYLRDNIIPDLQTYLPRLQSIQDAWYSVYLPAFGSLMSTTEEIQRLASDLLGEVREGFSSMANSAREITAALTTTDNRPNVTVNATQADARALAEQIIQILRQEKAIA